MHFNADDSSVKMVIVSSVQPTTSVLFSEYVIILERFMRSRLKVKDMRLGLFLLPENLTQPRPSAAENVSSCAPIAVKPLGEGITFGEDLACIQRKDRRQREISCYYRINNRERQLSKERTKRQTKNFVRLCTIANYAEILKIG